MTELRQDQIELLYEAQRADSPVIVEEDALNRVRTVLGKALRERGLADPSPLSLEALASQFVNEDDEGDLLSATDIEEMSQQPETGGQDTETLAASEGKDTSKGVEALSADDREHVEGLVERHYRMVDRTPKYAEKCRDEALELVSGIDDIEELRDVL